MHITYEAPDWREYRMDWYDPHRELEPLEREVAIVDDALEALVPAGLLPSSHYSRERMLAHRDAVRQRFEIPWTAISPRMERLIYAINAIVRPDTMVAVGIFCGNTFACNAGAAVGPGACYEADRLVGLEIRPQEAARAQRNIATIDERGICEILAEDGRDWLAASSESIDLLYLDADGLEGQGKSIYLELLEEASHLLVPGSVVLAHNAVNAADGLSDYLAHVRDGRAFRASATMIVDDQGLEVTRR
jgi:predicted O-methyltransferase YrrM